MASQLYSRYVPPKKSKDSLNSGSNAAATGPVASTSTSQPSRPSTRKDASSTYSRYVPPSSKPKSQRKPAVESGSDSVHIPQKRDRDEESERHFTSSSPKSKKKRLDEKIADEELHPASEELPRDTSGDGDISISNTAGNAAEEVKVDKKKSKKRKKHEAGEEGSEPITTETTDSRQKSVLSRRDKSLKKSEKIARKVAAQTDHSDEFDQDKHLPLKPEEVHPLGPLPQPEPIIEVGEPTFSTLPRWLSNPVRVSSTARAPFFRYGVSEEVSNSLERLGFKDAFAIQTAVLPHLLPGDQNHRGDILVSAATGSGKTLAYVLPMVEEISKTVVTRLQGLIVMPTRELVRQAREVCESCASVYASGDSRRQIHIGVATGSQTLKMEQASIMNKFNKVDPERYREFERRENAKWDVTDESPEPDFRYDEDDSMSTLVDHVVEYTPKVDILICTPGRLVEHLKSTPAFTLEKLKWLVIDEADKLLDQSFQQWLETVMGALAVKEEREMSKITDGLRVTDLRKIVLSATMTKDLGQLSSLRLNAPKLIVLEGPEDRSVEGGDDTKSREVLSLPDTLEESAVKVEDGNDKPLYLLELFNRTLPNKPNMKNAASKISKSAESSSDDLTDSESTEDSSDETSSDDEGSSVSSDESSVSSETPTLAQKQVAEEESGGSAKPRGILIFTKSNENAVRLSRLIALLEPNYSDVIGTLTSTIRHSSRKGTLKDFRSGKVSILIASDLVARGLDLPNLAHVINYDMPTSLTSYVHRVGRTARAGKAGHAWTLFTPTEGRWFWHDIARTELVQRAAGKKVARVNISGDIFEDDLRQRYETALTALGEEAGAR